MPLDRSLPDPSENSRSDRSYPEADAHGNLTHGDRAAFPPLKVFIAPVREAEDQTSVFGDVQLFHHEDRPRQQQDA